MFQNLKINQGKKSNYKNMPWPDGKASQGLKNFHSNPRSSSDASQTLAPIKGNEKDRLVRCRTCGFPCDMERESKSKEGTWAGLGVSFGDSLEKPIISIDITNPAVVYVTNHGYSPGDIILISDSSNTIGRLLNSSWIGVFRVGPY